MSKLETYRACPICGRTACTVFIPRERLAAEAAYRDRLFRNALPPGTPDEMLDDLTVFTNAYEADLIACKCGLVCRDPRLASDAAVRAYANDEYSTAWLDKSFRQYLAGFRARMPDLVRRVGEHARVLEIGSYVGGFLAAANEVGWEAQGVDVGRRVGEFSRGKGLNVFTGSVQDAHYASALFDAVFAWVCFDQLPDPWGVVREIRRIVKPGGWLFLQVPNGEFVKWTEAVARLPGLRERVWRLRSYTGIAGFPYPIGYTRRSLERLLGTSGFEHIRFRNRMNISDGAAEPVYVLSEQIAVVKRIHWLAQFLYRVSGHTWLVGPWMEVACRKKEET